jgi:uncharacterized OsmC-like protein
MIQSGKRKNSNEEEVVKMTNEKMVNGVNVEQLFSTIDQVKANPKIAQFKFRAKNTWVDGTHNQATIKDFFGALKEDDTRDPLIFELDEPPVLCGKNLGANPVEYLLVALSGCLTTSLVAHAAAKGIEVKKVESRYEGDLDLQGFLGLSDEVPVGYQNIRVYFHIEADLSETEKEELIRMAKKYSPVFNTITKSAPVTVELKKK